VFIGAPGYSVKGSGQLGAVYFASLDMLRNHPAIEADQPFLYGLERYSRFGYSLAALDVNCDGVDDLVVAAPAYGPGGPSDISDYYAKSYFGRVHVYLGTKGFGIKPHSQPDFTIKMRSEEDVFMNLGQLLRVSDCNGDGKLDLIIGAPMSQQGGDKRGYIAVLYEFMSKLQEGGSLLYLDDADFTLTGKDNYQWFGFDAVCTKDHTLIVSSPGKRIPT
jgi:FG-GAP repeat